MIWVSNKDFKVLKEKVEQLEKRLEDSQEEKRMTVNREYMIFEFKKDLQKEMRDRKGNSNSLVYAFYLALFIVGRFHSYDNFNVKVFNFYLDDLQIKDNLVLDFNKSESVMIILEKLLKRSLTGRGDNIITLINLTDNQVYHISSSDLEKCKIGIYSDIARSFRLEGF